MTGGGDEPARRTDPGVKETAPGGMLPAGAPGGVGRVPDGVGRVPDGAGRVRRPADLLFAVLSLAVVAVVLGRYHGLFRSAARNWPTMSRPGCITSLAGCRSAAEVVSGVAGFVLAVIALVVLVRQRVAGCA